MISDLISMYSFDFQGLTSTLYYATLSQRRATKTSTNWTNVPMLTLASFLQYQAPSWGTHSFLPALGRKSPETEPSGSSRNLSRRDWRHGSCSLGSLSTQQQSEKVLQNEDNVKFKSKHFTSRLWNHSGSQQGRGTLRRGWEWRCWSWSLMGHVPGLRYQTAKDMKRQWKYWGSYMLISHVCVESAQKASQ